MSSELQGCTKTSDSECPSSALKFLCCECCKPAFYCYLNWHWIFPAGLSSSHGVVVLRQSQRQNIEEVGWLSSGGLGIVLRRCFYPSAIGRLLTGLLQPFPGSNGLGRRFGPGLSEAPSWIVCCKVSCLRPNPCSFLYVSSENK